MTGGPKSGVSVLEEVPWQRSRELLPALEGSGDAVEAALRCLIPEELRGSYRHAREEPMRFTHKGPISPPLPRKDATSQRRTSKQDSTELEL